MSNLVGTRWTSKDGARTVTVTAELSEFCGERQFRIRNDQTGRETHISASGLRRKFREIDG